MLTEFECGMKRAWTFAHDQWSPHLRQWLGNRKLKERSFWIPTKVLNSLTRKQ